MKHTRGYFTLLVLVYSAVFLTLLSSLAGYIFIEKRLELAKENKEKAFQLAEAGLEYYRWHLAHWPSDLKDGTGQPGPYVHTVPDPEGGTLGTFSLDISGGEVCGQVNSLVISATGAAAADPTYTRTLTARYTKPTVAEFNTIVNSNVWVGADRIITGPYHSNGGIRMDATHNADVTSGVASWLCTSSFGCTPNQNQNGVFGAGSQPELWRFPVPSVDFAGISVDLSALKNYATTSGIYVPPSNGYGWRVTLRADGQMELRKVVGAIQVWSYSIEGGWQQERTVMSSVQDETTSIVLPTCPVIFVEDNVWLDGVVSGHVTLAAADVTGASIDRSVILSDNITYAGGTNDGLTVIGEQDVLIGLQVPDVMTINGVFIAQKGHFGRNHYCQSDCSTQSGNQGLPGTLDPYVTRSTLNTNGTVVSNGRVGTKWMSGNTFISGFALRNDTFDRDLAANPPPFTPAISDDFRFIEWRDQR
ncbi:MAG: hypothetical protein AAB955_01600 [Patescibacteria group bacterium]